MRPLSLQQQVGRHGNQQQGHHGGDHQRRNNGNPHMTPQDADHVLRGKDKRQENSDGGQGGGYHRTPNLSGPLDHCFIRSVAFPSQPVDILQHDHTVVEEHAYRQGHTHQGKAVDGDSEGIEEVKSRKDRHRDGQGNNGHNPYVFQKDPQDENGQQSPYQGQRDDLVDVFFHGFSSIRLNDDFDVTGGQFTVETFDDFLGAVRQVDEVSLGIAHQEHRNGIHAVDTAQGGFLLHSKIDLGHIF